MIKYLYYFLLFCIPFTSYAQYDHGCDGERFLKQVIINVEKTTVTYGNNTQPDGQNIDLKMDIYSPQDDNAFGRAVVILAHGGSFIGGSRQDMAETCQRLAEYGYVTATIDYRKLNLIQGIPDSVSSMDIAVKAAHDMKGAIRFMKGSAFDEGNPYNIDPDMIFIGGYSAGAITALIAGVLSEDEIKQDFLLDVLEENGGIQGTTGDTTYLQYGEEVRGILNYSGAVYDTSWIDSDDPIIMSLHGDADETVAYGHDFVQVFNMNIVLLHGSGSINEHTSNSNIPSFLYTVEGGGHENIYFTNEYEDVRISFQAAADTIMAEIICGFILNTITDPIPGLIVSPNPTSGQLYFEGITELTQLYIFDIHGRLIMKNTISYPSNFNLSNYPAGTYYYKAQNSLGISTGKIFKQN